MIADSFYTLKPWIPRWLQIQLRRRIVRYRSAQYRDIWPMAEYAGTPPPAWPGWPGGKRFALILSHDVESSLGVSRCEQLADLEEERGLRSTFGFVPLRYRTSEYLRRSLAARGFEIVVHDLYHDGKLYRNRRIFETRRPRIQEFLAQWQTRGFCSGAMHHNLPWIDELDIDYDISTYDIDPFEPQACGFGRIFPFWVQRPGSRVSGFVELPYTLPQDFTLFILLCEQTNTIWKTKLDWIVEKGGMALIKTHPDYMAFSASDSRIDHYPVDLYKDFLDYVQSRYAGEFWLAHPSEMARFWRTLPSPGMDNTTPITPTVTLCQSCRRAHAAGWLTNYPPPSLRGGPPESIAVRQDDRKW